MDRFLEYIARKAIPIVVGSYWPLPLILDKPLAELLAYQLGERGFWPIILTDELLYRPLHRALSLSALRARTQSEDEEGETLLDVMAKHKAPIVAIESCHANNLVCDVAREGEPRRNPYGDERPTGVGAWRGTEVFTVYGHESEEMRDLLKSIPDILE